MEQLQPNPEEQERAELEALQIQVAHEIATTASESVKGSQQVTQFLFEQAVAFDNRAVAEVLWPHVNPSFLNMSRWQKITDDPVLVPRVYESLLTTELDPRHNDDWEDDAQERGYKQHDQAVVRLGRQLAETESWIQVPALYSKMYGSKRLLFKELSEVAAQQGNQVVMRELLGLQAEGEDHPFKVAAALTSVEPVEAAHLLHKVGYSEFTTIDEQLTEAEYQKYAAAFRHVLLELQSTIVVGEFLNSPLSADQKRGQTNWSRSMESLDREAAKLLAQMQAHDIDTTPFVEALAIEHAEAKSWIATEGMLDSLNSLASVDQPDQRVYQQFIAALDEHVTEPTLRAAVSAKIAEQQASNEKYGTHATKYYIRDRSWDPDQMIVEPHHLQIRRVVERSIERQEHYTRLKEMSIDAIIEIQDPIARADGILTKLNRDNATLLGPQLLEATRNIFDDSQRLARQFDFLHQTI